MATIAAGEAKAQFLRLLKDVELKRETVIVTKYGREVAKLVPIELAQDVDPLDQYRIPGVEVVGDIAAPIYTDEEWDGFFKASLAQLNDPA